jgi:RHS repeat-associated protein
MIRRWSILLVAAALTLLSGLSARGSLPPSAPLTIRHAQPAAPAYHSPGGSADDGDRLYEWPPRLRLKSVRPEVPEHGELKRVYGYDALGRFLTRDPIGYANGLNLYQYVRSNPLAYTDPWGLTAKAGTAGFSDLGQWVPEVYNMLPDGHSHQDRYSDIYLPRFAPAMTRAMHDRIGPVGTMGDPDPVRGAAHFLTEVVGGAAYAVEGVAIAGVEVWRGDFQKKETPLLGWAELNIARGLEYGDPLQFATGTAELLSVAGMRVRPKISTRSTSRHVNFDVDSPAPKKPAVGDRLQRNWGGDSGPHGQSWTRDPYSRQSRNSLGLETQNTGEFVSSGTLVDDAGVAAKPADPWGRFAGGGDEVLVPNAQQQIRLDAVTMPDDPLPFELPTDPRPRP